MATKSDAPALLDVFVRHQIYLEGLKAAQGPIFDAKMIALRRELRGIFFDLEFEELSRMTRRQLEVFIARLRSAQLVQFNLYTQQVLDDLKRFMEDDTQMVATIMAKTQEAEDVDESRAAILALLSTAGSRTLWAQVASTPMAANGVTAEDFVRQFTASSVTALENIVRRGYANKSAPGEVLQALTGTSRLNYRDGLLHRSAYQARGMTATLIQHAAGIAQVAVGEQYFARYRWVSVLDAVTSNVCRSRAGKVYVYGDGPVPPAHPNCRSHIEPYDGVEVPMETYYAWMKRQPDVVQNDILGENKAAALRSGELKSDAMPQFSEATPLTLAQFKAKLNKLLAT